MAESKQEQPKSLISGIHHVGLTVSDLDATLKFFSEALGYAKAGEVPSYPAIFVSNGKSFITLWQADKEANAFDRKKNVGLHHLSLAVPSEEALNAVFEKVEKHPGVKVEFKPELLMGGPAKHFMFREPSGNRMEITYWP
eukprot:CAMPEP_0167784164 /NCGR_PEP_ID=MMETSP0111_2-20121227/7483_1 /TAXON_ID=91324 /ORGANISM="Lotharella globosa, Strain CCCM811" /LENGTH=139 /DNA_ID=CAMNT_0007675201 /DNA_START=65 /DNA_END=484 /DNA_ORIENTATION=-